MAPSPSADAFVPMNPRDYLILFTLMDGELHGYGIVKEVESRTRGQVLLDPANLYRAIKRLIRDGLLAETERRPLEEAADERRRYYQVTPLGQKVVALEAGRLAELADAARARKLIPERELPA